MGMIDTMFVAGGLTGSEPVGSDPEKLKQAVLLTRVLERYHSTESKSMRATMIAQDKLKLEGLTALMDAHRSLIIAGDKNAVEIYKAQIGLKKAMVQARTALQVKAGAVSDEVKNKVAMVLAQAGGAGTAGDDTIVQALNEAMGVVDQNGSLIVTNASMPEAMRQAMFAAGLNFNEMTEEQFEQRFGRYSNVGATSAVEKFKLAKQIERGQHAHYASLEQEEAETQAVADEMLQVIKAHPGDEAGEAATKAMKPLHSKAVKTALAFEAAASKVEMATNYSGALGNISNHLNTMQEEVKDWNNTSELFEQLMREITTGTPQGYSFRDQLGQVVADPKFREWAKDNGYANLGQATVDPKTGKMSYQRGADDMRAFKLFNYQLKHPARYQSVMVRGGANLDDKRYVKVQVPMSEEDLASYRGANGKYAMGTINGKQRYLTNEEQLTLVKSRETADSWYLTDPGDGEKSLVVPQADGSYKLFVLPPPKTAEVDGAPAAPAMEPLTLTAAEWEGLQEDVGSDALERVHDIGDLGDVVLTDAPPKHLPAYGVVVPKHATGLSAENVGKVQVDVGGRIRLVDSATITDLQAADPGIRAERAHHRSMRDAAYASTLDPSTYAMTIMDDPGDPAEDDDGLPAFTGKGSVTKISEAPSRSADVLSAENERAIEKAAADDETHAVKLEGKAERLEKRGDSRAEGGAEALREGKGFKAELLLTAADRLQRRAGETRGEAWRTTTTKKDSPTVPAPKALEVDEAGDPLSDADLTFVSGNTRTYGVGLRGAINDTAAIPAGASKGRMTGWEALRKLAGLSTKPGPHKGEGRVTETGNAHARKAVPLTVEQKAEQDALHAARKAEEVSLKPDSAGAGEIEGVNKKKKEPR